jgi:hypothetical protein
MWEQLNLPERTATSPSVEPSPKIDGVPKDQAPAKDRETRVILCMAMLAILFFLDTAALKFLNVSEEIYGIFWLRRNWLYAHVVAGVFAILIGPVQFWPGVKQSFPVLHRVMGVFYVISAGVGGVAAFYLALQSDFGWMFSMGLGSMATAWMISTGLATVAVCRGMIEQHREWMVRSYVLTFGFVLLRATTGILDLAGVGSIPERFVFSSWVSWSVPLMITEAILQGRKIFGGRSRLPR